MLRKVLSFVSTTQRCCSTVGKEVSAKIDATKEKKTFYGINKHLEHAEKYEKFLSKETENYEDGVQYLAHMMGKEPNDFSEKELEEAVRYLFPSSLYSRTARPMLLPPTQIIPKQKSLQCSMDGRPFESFYYTRYPNFYNLMNEATEVLYDLKRVEDKNIQNGFLIPRENQSWQATKNSTFWVNAGHIRKATLEPISPQQYEQFLTLMERIFAHPYSHRAEEFIMQFRESKPTEIKSVELPKLQEDKATGRSYAISYGQRKMAFAEVRIYQPGNGKLSVNNGRFLDAFPMISDREQVITPLVLSRLLGKVDVEVTVSGSGESSQAGAARLAIARAITCFLDPSIIRRLRLAGLLTMDMRFREKKKSGMPKARKTFIWKRR